MILNERVSAIVTGGASGMGAATVRAMADHGVKVAVFDVNDDQGHGIAEEVGGIYCRCDVGNGESVQAAFDKARSVHGQERILVNCAAISSIAPIISPSSDGEGFTPIDCDHFDDVIQVNLTGTVRCAAISAAGMASTDALGNERGVIINTSSIVSRDSGPWQTPYVASKSALLGLTQALARDLQAHGIRHNTILPGFFDTPMAADVTDEQRTMLEQSIVYPKRLGMPNEFASLALQLVANEYINGECIRIDGGLRIRW